jgi:hypothetical protein
MARLLEVLRHEAASHRVRRCFAPLMPMTDIEKARRLFQDAGLPFPTIPENLAAQLKEGGRWLFSTRPIEMSPYNLKHYVHEVEGSQANDYAVLSHSGHGVNRMRFSTLYRVPCACSFTLAGVGCTWTLQQPNHDPQLLLNSGLSRRSGPKRGRVQAGERLMVVSSDC